MLPAGNRPLAGVPNIDNTRYLAAAFGFINTIRVLRFILQRDPAGVGQMRHGVRNFERDDNQEQAGAPERQIAPVRALGKASS